MEDSTWGLVQRWLDRCVQTHTSCNYKPPGNFIPSRLLELRTKGGGKVFRVIERDQFEPGRRYITLSHCWGSDTSDSRLLLLMNTAQSLREDQPLSLLPRTFRDAFTIIERLNVRYLWIDRLCIFQDSQDDWRRESSSMGYIYKNALLNISALSAKNDGGGCFVSRDPAKVTATIVNICVDGPNNPKPYRFRMEKGWAWRMTFESEPLPNRGWILQERVLSPRVLHFGKQVFWECGECNCCELHPKTVYEFDKRVFDDPEPEAESLHIITFGSNS